MGWAPSVIFSGLLLTIWFFHCLREHRDSSECVNLAPLVQRVKQTYYSVLTFASQWTVISKTSTRILVSSTPTATRSQFRGVGKAFTPYWLYIVTAILLVGITHAMTSSPCWGEGYASAMAGMETEDSSVKPHGEELKGTFESCQPHKSKQSVLKRSYRRALNRIRRHVYTWYRGQLWTCFLHHTIPQLHISLRPIFQHLDQSVEND